MKKSTKLNHDTKARILNYTLTGKLDEAIALIQEFNSGFNPQCYDGIYKKPKAAVRRFVNNN